MNIIRQTELGSLGSCDYTIIAECITTVWFALYLGSMTMLIRGDDDAWCVSIVL